MDSAKGALVQPARSACLRLSDRRLVCLLPLHRSVRFRMNRHHEPPPMMMPSLRLSAPFVPSALLGTCLVLLFSAAWPTLASEPAQAAGPLRLFVSGHSLTDNPIPDDIVQIAASLGTPARYNQQIVPGSTIKARTHGQGNWSGYRQGKNRQGSNTDVIDELRSGKAIGGDRYGVLLITERHDLLGPLIWEDSIRHLRHFHELAHKANPKVQTHFYASWLAIQDKSNPQAWVRYERAADQAWQCLSTRVNTSLAHEKRSDRLKHIPAGAALAELVDRATRQQLPGISQGSTKATLDQLFTDDVHLTRAGAYYMALVSYSAIAGRSPVGAWAPAGISGPQAQALQSVAWDVISGTTKTKAQAQAASLDQCRNYLANTFCETFWTFTGNPGAIGSCKNTLSQAGRDNPLHFDAARDAAYWLPAP